MEPSMFYASSTVGNVIIIDARSGNRIRTYKGHAAPINDFLENTHNKWLVTAGDDFVCNVYDLMKEPESAKAVQQEEKKEEN